MKLFYALGRLIFYKENCTGGNPIGDRLIPRILIKAEDFKDAKRQFKKWLGPKDKRITARQRAKREDRNYFQGQIVEIKGFLNKGNKSTIFELPDSNVSSKGADYSRSVIIH